MSAIVLYSSSGSPFGRKVQVVMAEKGLSYDYVEVDPYNTPEGFESINPADRVPVLVDRARRSEGQGGVICDSSAICAYLERSAPTPRLYPNDALELGQALWLEEYADVDLEVPVGYAWYHLARPRFAGGESDTQAAAESWSKHAPKRLDYLEKLIADREYFVGRSLSIADVAIASCLSQLELAPDSPALDQWPSLVSHYARMLDRPSFKAVLDQHRKFLSPWLAEEQ